MVQKFRCSYGSLGFSEFRYEPEESEELEELEGFEEFEKIQMESA